MTKINLYEKTISALFMLAGLAVSCKKDAEPTVTDRLTAHTWKATSFLENGTPETAWCTLNSTSKYNADGTGVYTQGDNLGACSGTSIGDTFHFQWTLLNDETLFYSSYTPGYDDTVFIESLNDSELKLRYTIEYSSGSTGNWIEGFIPN